MEGKESRSQMQFEATLELRDGYLHAQLVPGFEITPERMNRLWSEIAAACRRFGIRQVLTEGEVAARRMTTMDSFDNAATAARLVPGLAMACVVSGHVADQQTEFFKTAGTNLGVHVDFFKSRAEALRWLGVESAST